MEIIAITDTGIRRYLKLWYVMGRNLIPRLMLTRRPFGTWYTFPGHRSCRAYLCT